MFLKNYKKEIPSYRVDTGIPSLEKEPRDDDFIAENFYFGIRRTNEALILRELLLVF